MITISRNGLVLSSDTETIFPGQGSANITVDVINDDSYSNYAIVPYIGWYRSGIMKSIPVIYENNQFKIPSNAFIMSGRIAISLALVSKDEVIVTLPIYFIVEKTPHCNIDLLEESKWELLVSNLVANLYDRDFENRINNILETAEDLNENTKGIQDAINTVISSIGEYEWDGTRIRFKKGDGQWGEWNDIAEGFVAKAEMETYIESFRDRLYPIGIIVEFNQEVDPNETIGGTWEKFGEGKVLVGLDENDDDFSSVNNVGGEKEHVLTVDEMPAHNHVTTRGDVNLWLQDGTYGNINVGTTTNANKTNAGKLLDTGGDQPHNNMPPYVVVYRWVRTA